MIDQSRRGVLKALLTAPLAAPAAARTAAAEIGLAAHAEALAGVAVAGRLAQAVPGFGTANAKRLLMLHKIGMAPEWLTADVRDRARSVACTITPDIAALRSVSLSSKMRMNEDRLVRQAFDEMETSMMRDIARNAFWEENRGN